ncbi:MAG: ankyrin repeat domain-containing protein [Pyrinomonadaceae bacterium]
MRSIILFLILAFASSATLAQERGSASWILKEKMVRACLLSDVAAVKEYLRQGVSPNARDEFGQPLIMLAVRPSVYGGYSESSAMVNALLDAGASINAANDFGSTALFVPNRSNIDLPSDPLTLLLKRGADKQKKDKFGMNAEEYGDDQGEQKMAEEDRIWRLLFEGGVRTVDYFPKVKRYSNGATFLMGAAYYAEYYQKPTMFRPDASVDNFGETYLFYLAGRTKFFAGELSDIDPKIADMKNKLGETALIRGAKFGDDFFVIKMLAAGADPELRDAAGFSPLDHAVMADSTMTTLNLLMKADPTRAATDGKTPLQRAVQRGSIKAVAAFAQAKLALEKLEIEIKKGNAEPSDKKLAAAFRKINVDQTDPSGRTPLMYAAEMGNLEMVKLLLLLSPDRKLTDKNKMTALELARKNRHQDVVNLLTAR